MQYSTVPFWLHARWYQGPPVLPRYSAVQDSTVHAHGVAVCFVWLWLPSTSHTNGHAAAQVLELCVQALGETHLKVSATYNNMANVHYCKADYNAALKLYQRALDLRVAAYGSSHLRIADSYGNMAMVYNCQVCLTSSYGPLIKRWPPPCPHNSNPFAVEDVSCPAFPFPFPFRNF